MDLEQLKEQMIKLPNGQDLFNKVVELVEQEREIGKEAHRKVNSEASGLRKYKKALETLGLTQDDDLDQFVTKIKNPDTSDNLTLKSLKMQYDAMKNERDEERRKSSSRLVSEKLTSVLADKVYGHDLLIKSLIDDGKVVVQDDNVYFKDGSDGLITLEDGVKKLLEERKDIVKSNQVSGSRTNGTQRNNTSNLLQIATSGDRSAIRAKLPDILKEYGINK